MLIQPPFVSGDCQNVSACAPSVGRTKHIYLRSSPIVLLCRTNRSQMLHQGIQWNYKVKRCPTISDSPRSTATSLQCYSIIMCPYTFNLLRSLLPKKALSCSSSHFKSTLLSPGPPAQWPQILGNISSCPTPGFMCATSYSESSGL